MSVKSKVLGNWRAWNYPVLMVLTFLLSIIPALIVAVSVSSHYTGPLKYVLMASIMYVIMQGVMIVAAILD